MTTGFADFALLAGSDIGANRLRRALYQFGGHFLTGQKFHLPTAMIESNLLANQPLHAAHPGREIVLFHV